MKAVPPQLDRRPQRQLTVKRRAFTLIEMIVVISIVGVLIALLLPALALARREARSVACQSNLRSMYQGFKRYQDSSDGRLPLTESPFRIDHDLLSPVKEIAAHLDVQMPGRDSYGDLRSSAPWRCPSDRSEADKWGWSYDYWPAPLFSYYRLDGNPAGKVTAIYEADSSLPLIVDAFPGHAPESTVKPQQSNGHARFMLRYDGRIEKLAEFTDR